MVREQVFAPRRVSRFAPGAPTTGNARIDYLPPRIVGYDLTEGSLGVPQADNKIYAQWSETSFSAIFRRASISSVVI